jgi:AcrR family transcriptional regulator
MSEPPREKQSYHHGDLRVALVRAAEEVIAEFGPQKLTLREIARRAGVSHAAPYRHFANKKDLIGAVVAQSYRELTKALQQVQVVHENPLTRFEAMFHAYVDFATADVARFRLMFGSEVPEKDKHPELKLNSEESFQVVTDTIVACQEVGLIRDGNSQELAITCWSTCHGVAVLMVDNQLPDSFNSDKKAVVTSTASNLYIGMRPLS